MTYDEKRRALKTLDPKKWGGTSWQDIF